MEKYFLNDDIKVFYVTASSFPDGIMEAYKKLQSIVPAKDRKLYGISYPQNGKIVYKAAAKEAYEGEAEKHGCETFVIPRGEYISELLTDWRKNEAVIGETFKKLLAQQGIDKNGFCLEEYLNENDVRCMVPLKK
jgi:hypothetical protein